MSSGADRKAFRERSKSVPARLAATVRSVQRADLRGGTLKSVPFSTSRHAYGTITGRLWARSRHPSTLNAESDKSPGGRYTRNCPGACAVHEASVHARRPKGRCRAKGVRNEHLSVPKAFHAGDTSPVVHTRCAAIVPWPVTRACRGVQPCLHPGSGAGPPV
jgi:hypothetical protein